MTKDKTNMKPDKKIEILEIKLKEIITENVEMQIYEVLGNRLRELHADLDHEIDGIIKKVADSVYKKIEEALKETK